MPLPENFSPWENLQSALMRVQNRRVRSEFRDVGDDNWDPDITTPRGQLRVACTLVDNDTATMTLLRMYLFDIVLQGASALWPPLYTIPADRFQQEVRFKPQVTLYFREDMDEVETGYSPLDAEISFRLTEARYDSLQEAELRALATRIQTEFAPATGYRWRKGRVQLRYHDLEKGYKLRINAVSESEGREVINKVLDIRNHAIDGDYLKIVELGQTPPIVPPTEFILGQSRRTPRRYPVGNVRFQWAECHVWGVQRPIVLIDRSNRRSNPLIRI